MPSSTGKPGEIILVMDSAKWEGKLGDQVREVFRSPVPGLPREEALFSLRYVDPRKFNSVLKGVRNLILVSTMDGRSRGNKILKGYFTKTSRDRIQKDTSLYVFTDDNLFAKDQKVMYLFGQNDAYLQNKLKTNKQKLRDHFNNVEKKRLKKELYAAKEVKGISKLMREKHKFDMRIPFAFQLVDEKEGFIWIRQVGQEIDKSVFIAYQDYLGKSVFQKDSIIQLRNAITHQELFEDPDNPESFVTTETILSPLSREITFNSKYAVETRGLWKTNNISMGGPFLSYCFVDEKLNRLYYIEGFVYSPGKMQRETMREIETILQTFKTSVTIEQK